jgi:hypothetical protein
MQLLKKSLCASFVVQVIVLAIVAVSTLTGTEQSAFLWMSPFVAGVPLGSFLLQPLLGMLSPPTLLKLAMAAAVVSNFIVYAAIFYAWVRLREKFSTRNHLSATV